MSDGETRAGSLEDETARLLEALGWSANRQPEGELLGDGAELLEDEGELPREAGSFGEGVGRPSPVAASEDPDRPADTAPEPTHAGADAAGAEHPGTCTWCPLCQGVDALRTANPEAVERLAEAVTLLVSALSELAGHVRERVPPGQRGRAANPGAEDRSAGAPRPPQPVTRPGGAATGAGGSAAYDIPVTDEE